MFKHDLKFFMQIIIDSVKNNFFMKMITSTIAILNNLALKKYLQSHAYKEKDVSVCRILEIGLNLIFLNF